MVDVIRSQPGHRERERGQHQQRGGGEVGAGGHGAAVRPPTEGGAPRQHRGWTTRGGRRPDGVRPAAQASKGAGQGGQACGAHGGVVREQLDGEQAMTALSALALRTSRGKPACTRGRTSRERGRGAPAGAPCSWVRIAAISLSDRVFDVPFADHHWPAAHPRQAVGQRLCDVEDAQSAGLHAYLGRWGVGGLHVKQVDHHPAGARAGAGWRSRPAPRRSSSRAPITRVRARTRTYVTHNGQPGTAISLVSRRRGGSRPLRPGANSLLAMAIPAENADNTPAERDRLPLHDRAGPGVRGVGDAVPAPALPGLVTDRRPARRW